MNIKIAIVDDVKMTRLGLSFLLKQHPELEICCEAENGRFFIQSLSTCKPDIVLMDINMPLLDGISATLEALAINPQLKVIALTNDDGENYIDDMTSAGAKGFLMKSVESAELKKAIITVYNGGTYIAPELISFYNKAKISSQIRESLSLTALENNVLQLLCTGKSLHEIANELLVDISIIEKQCEYLSTKTKTKNAVGLVLFAIKNNLVKI